MNKSAYINNMGVEKPSDMQIEIISRFRETYPESSNGWSDNEIRERYGNTAQYISISICVGMGGKRVNPNPPPRIISEDEENEEKKFLTPKQIILLFGGIAIVVIAEYIVLIGF